MPNMPPGAFPGRAFPARDRTGADRADGGTRLARDDAPGPNGRGRDADPQAAEAEGSGPGRAEPADRHERQPAVDRAERADPQARVDAIDERPPFDPSDPFDQAVPLLSPDVQLPSSWCPEDTADLGDAVREFRAALESPLSADMPLQHLAGEIGGHLDSSMEEARWLQGLQASPTGQGLQFEFSVDVPGMGPLTGRMVIGKGRAELELQAHRPATAAALRAQAPQLRQLVQRHSEGDVELWVL
ncbi:flagellar hook-length control protein FliK [Roseateles sp. SL47]|uniref:flagellar hook-length control protein FliK n=1 Tax=Roseateles sp. SL47 TaxID=2995138 RepID=UPI0022704656|nr:flagellar hook-length control protein FliK [Roseateles sp. SL47]WAC74580.1 flagellar hook-length control protein FliK [Roseateles sp. SL47]